MQNEKYKYPFKNKGYCICCERNVKFNAKGTWYRDSYLCMNCGSIPRERALMYVIEENFPEWRSLTIHESSPVERGASKKIKSECPNYIASQYYPGEKEGAIIEGFRNENLDKQTFQSDSLDLVITQDVMEHIFNPQEAFREIGRTLKDGGAHIFTVPLVNKNKPSEPWAILEKNEVVFLKKPEYHGNPIDPNGSPVAYHWGYDIVNYIYRASGLITGIIFIDNISLGIRAELIEVLISRKL